MTTMYLYSTKVEGPRQKGSRKELLRLYMRISEDGLLGAVVDAT